MKPIFCKNIKDGSIVSCDLEYPITEDESLFVEVDPRDEHLLLELVNILDQVREITIVS